jgi:hypothetical protein
LFGCRSGPRRRSCCRGARASTAPGTGCRACGFPERLLTCWKAEICARAATVEAQSASILAPMAFAVCARAPVRFKQAAARTAIFGCDMRDSPRGCAPNMSTGVRKRHVDRRSIRQTGIFPVFLRDKSIISAANDKSSEKPIAGYHTLGLFERQWVNTRIRLQSSSASRARRCRCVELSTTWAMIATGYNSILYWTFRVFHCPFRERAILRSTFSGAGL